MFNLSKQRSQRGEYRNITSRMRAGDLQPIKAHRIMGGESGLLKEEVFIEFDQLAGRIVTPVTVELTAVMVPLQAMDLLANPEEPLAGSAESVRQKLLSGTPIFGLEEETELSKACSVVPRSVNGTKMVSETVRLAHNCAVNYLRRRKYVKAEQLPANSTAITPALLSQTILDRFNGVLDPEDRVNGAVNLEGEIPVLGLWAEFPHDDANSGQFFNQNGNVLPTNTKTRNLRVTDNDEFGGNGWNKVTASLGQSGQNISLVDFYQAEKMDELVRQAREMVDNNPEYGEQMVAQWAHGLSVDPGKQPFVIYQRTESTAKVERLATDGPNLEESVTDMIASLEMAVPIPRTEFGGIVMCFVTIRPDETLAEQPHPLLTEEWSPMNFVADELAIDPVPVTFRELDSEVDQADEGEIAFYVGNHHIKKSYINYGYNRNLDRTTVARRTSVWQLEIPMSVTPQSVLYPETISHYPWVDFSGDVATVTAESQLTVATPIVFGPTPVEELAAIEDLDIFEEDEA